MKMKPKRVRSTWNACANQQAINRAHRDFQAIHLRVPPRVKNGRVDDKSSARACMHLCHDAIHRPPRSFEQRRTIFRGWLAFHRRGGFEIKAGIGDSAHRLRRGLHLLDILH